MKKTRMVNSTMMEINKPSELSQILFVDRHDTNYNDIVKITPGQVDMLNCIFYHAREFIVKNSLDVSLKGSTTLELPLKTIASDIGKYADDRYDRIIDDLIALSNINIVINSLGKNKEEDTMLITRFILEMEVSKHRTNLHKKKVTFLLSNKLISKFIDVKKCFAKMFLKIQFSLNSKYSKLLYELLKDYEGIKVITVDLITLTCLLNDLQFKEWSIFRVNVLERAITEINEKSDIKVSYEPIKEKLEGQRKQVTKIKFFIEKQSEERLQELGLLNPPAVTNIYYSRSKTKLDKLVKGGYKIFDEEMWIETDIKKNEIRYKDEALIDEWLQGISQNERNDFCMKLARFLNAADVTVYIDNDYHIRGLLSNDMLTRSATETLDKIIELGDIIELGEKSLDDHLKEIDNS